MTERLDVEFGAEDAVNLGGWLYLPDGPVEVSFDIASSASPPDWAG